MLWGKHVEKLPVFIHRMVHFENGGFIIVWRESDRRTLSLEPSCSVFGKSPKGHIIAYLTIGSECTVNVKGNRRDSINMYFEETLRHRP